MTLYHTVASDGTHILNDSRSKKYLFFSGNGGIEVSDTIPTIYAKLDIGSSGTGVSCVIGVIKLKVNRYLVLATGHEVTGSVMGKEVARVTSFEILSLNKESAAATKNTEEGTYLKLLHQHLSSATLYFSVNNEFDITNSLQRQLTHPDMKYDQRFWWNSYLCQDLLDSGGSDFVTPIVYGYFKSHSAEFKGHQPLEFALLTRRSITRAGTRYFRRGIDKDGNVANFNETEQIFTTSDGQIFSFLQTRGSVPVYWCEINNLKYKPNLVVSSKSSVDATHKHFKDQVDRYGTTYCVNLVNQKGYEKPVKSAFENAIESLDASLASKVKYIYFDFHHECRKMRWDRIRLLLDTLIKLDYTSDEYFHYNTKTQTVLSTQNKIVRTNCMDCLDRTNVVQSTLGRWVLQNQFTKAGYLASSNVTPWELLDPQFNLFFQSFWADNADAVSCAYSGTGALKTDFTRTGKRTRAGALNDLVNSISRYYKNNLKDGLRQDSYDLFLGNYRPYQDSVTSPFADRRPPYVQLLPYLMYTSLLVMLAMLWYPRGSVADWKNLLIIGGCLYFNIRSFSYLNKDGYQFVNWPKLSPLDYIQKVEVFDNEGKLTGVKYEEQENFKTVGKKKN